MEEVGHPPASLDITDIIVNDQTLFLTDFQKDVYSPFATLPTSVEVDVARLGVLAGPPSGPS